MGRPAILSNLHKSAVCLRLVFGFAEVGAVKRESYSYRQDPDMPDRDETHGLIVFDGECMLCLSFVIGR